MTKYDTPSSSLRYSPPFAATSPAANPERLGASYNDSKTEITFRVYSGRATRLEVWVYSDSFSVAEKWHAEMTVDPATKIWSKTVSVADLEGAGVTDPVYYGYRAWGPNWPFNAAWTKGSELGYITDVDADGNRFNPNKLLIDPYAVEISHDPRTAAQSSDAAYCSGPAQRKEDTGAIAPKGIVLKPQTADIGVKPERPFKDEIIYEVHLRGLTKHDDSIPAAIRGTYAVTVRKAAYLKSGVTAVEFLPVRKSNDQNDIEDSTKGDNYWGYDRSYFAPDRRYDKSPGGPTGIPGDG